MSAQQTTLDLGVQPHAMPDASSQAKRDASCEAVLDDTTGAGAAVHALGPGAALLRGLALPDEHVLLADLEALAQRTTFRHMVTPGGFRMSVAITNCGALGWVTSRSGYRYTPLDPLDQRPWQPMPASFSALASRAAALAGFSGFVPDACLVNRYAPGAGVTLHQDKNERDFAAPIVSVSLGLPAVFLFGGATRRERPQRMRLVHGDVMVWGGPSRLRYHGVAPVEEGEHPALGSYRFNLTFRRAG